MTAQSRTYAMARVLESVLVVTAAALAQRERGVAAPPMASSGAEGDLVPILRENLRAASQHVAMGHEGASFRECLHPACQDAANLIPHLETLEESATDGELDVIFDRVQAALEVGAFTEEMSEPATGDDSFPAPPAQIPS